MKRTKNIKKTSSYKSRKSPKSKNRKTFKPTFAIFSFLVVIFLIVIMVIFKIINLAVNPNNPFFPKLEISLKDITVEELDCNGSETTYENNSGKLITSSQSIQIENLAIKTRGNSTIALAKKPYQIKLANKTSLFDLAPAKKWVLLANYLDPSYLRTDIAYYLERALQEDHALNGNFLELYIDGSYRGLYYLSEKIENAKNRINLHDELGAIFEIDNLHTIPSDCYYSSNHDCITIHDEVNTDYANIASNNFLSKYNKLESAVSKKDYSMVEELVDVDSFAKYFLLSEFTANPDAYSSSFFMYLDGPTDKLHAGPGWDFDFSLSNRGWGADNINSLSPDEDTMFKDSLSKQILNGDTTDAHISTVSSIFYDLMEIPEFKQRVREIYQETLSSKKDELLKYIQKQANYIRPAALRDQERWKLPNNFDNEVEYLIDWVSKRYNHFEQTYGLNSNKLIQDPNLESQPPSVE